MVGVAKVSILVLILSCLVPSNFAFALSGGLRTSAVNFRFGSSSGPSLRMGLTLYGSQGSRSPLVNWGASELGLPLTMGDLSQNPHPFRQIPALTDDNGVLIFESGAILQYLYLKGAGDQDSESRRAAIISWIAWANASLDPICFIETPQGKVYDTGLKQPNKRIDTLDEMLSKKEFLVEGGFSTADVAVASYLLYVPQFFQGIDLTRWPNIVKYMKRCAARSAYGEAFGANVQQYLIASLDVMTQSGKDDDGKKKKFGIF
mmetsp:Transcript_24634/g.42985  ORF Transcript_24634/g.42985 Transcript_24634/m.42985 type:complete len:261 (+) Transcript_24634:33-815(+)